jgi:hypothetical protein
MSLDPDAASNSKPSLPKKEGNGNIDCLVYLEKLWDKAQTPPPKHADLCPFDRLPKIFSHFLTFF